MIVLGDVPTLPISRDSSATAMKMYSYLMYEQEGNFDFLVSLREDAKYRARRHRVEAKLQAATARVPCSKFVEVSPYFERANTGQLQLVTPFWLSLAYKDKSHLTPGGADMAKQLFQQDVFGRPTCCTCACD